jgi:hypothetical protein
MDGWYDTMLGVLARTGFIVFRSQTSQERSSNTQRIAEVAFIVDRFKIIFENFQKLEKIQVYTLVVKAIIS